MVFGRSNRRAFRGPGVAIFCGNIVEGHAVWRAQPSERAEEIGSTPPHARGRGIHPMRVGAKFAPKGPNMSARGRAQRRPGCRITSQ